MDREARRRDGTVRVYGFAEGLRAILDENGDKPHWSDFDFFDCLEVFDAEGSELANDLEAYRALLATPESERGPSYYTTREALRVNMRKEVRDMAVAMFFFDEYLGSTRAKYGV